MAKKFESPVRYVLLRSPFSPSIRDTCYKSQTKKIKHSKFNFMWFKLFPLPNIFLYLSLSLSSLLFSRSICLFSFVVDFYGCQRTLKVAKRVTLPATPPGSSCGGSSTCLSTGSKVAWLIGTARMKAGEERSALKRRYVGPLVRLSKVEKGKEKILPVLLSRYQKLMNSFKCCLTVF